MLPVLILSFVPFISLVTRILLLILSLAGTVIHNIDTFSTRQLIFIKTPSRNILARLICFVLTASGNHLLFFFRIPGYHLCDLQRHVHQIQDFALSAATKRNYHSGWNTYLKFCDFYKLQPLTASPSTIAAFITLVSFSVKSHHTINNYLSALRRLHVFCHLDASAFDDIHVKLTQTGLEKSMIHIPHGKAPLTPSILFQFHAHLNLRGSSHLALWCALLVGFFTFFRTANLVPQAFDSFSPQHVLSRGSVHFTCSRRS